LRIEAISVGGHADLRQLSMATRDEIATVLDQLAQGPALVRQVIYDLHHAYKIEERLLRNTWD
jgi:hypothetical protein